MDLFLTAIPLTISFLLGGLFLNILFSKKEIGSKGLFFVLAFAVGLGITAFISFFVLIVSGGYQKTLVLAAQLILLAALLFRQFKKKPVTWPTMAMHPLQDLVMAGLIVFLLSISWQIAYQYPSGGWDAWSVWNLKAKFIFLAGQRWVDLLSPKMWGSSPHYPLYLPLINVWIWGFFNKPAELTPAIVSMLFFLLIVLLLYASLRRESSSWVVLLAPLLLLSSELYSTLAVSQYCDIVVGFYLLASLTSLWRAEQEQSRAWLILGCILLGILSFTKSEGTIAALLIFMLMTIKKFLAKRSKQKFQEFIFGAIVFFLAALPTIIFNLFFSPGNQTFTNGLQSLQHPATFDRFKFCIAFLLSEMISMKWCGLWITVIVIGLLSLKRGWQRALKIFPLSLSIYLGIVLAYCFINTRFEIGWLLQVTLGRILASLLPSLLFWVFAACLNGVEGKDSKTDAQSSKS